MKFQFSLDPVLKVRSHRKQIEKQKLAEEEASRQKILSLRKEVQEKLQDYLKEDKDQDLQSLHMVKTRYEHLNREHRKMKKLSTELAQAENKVSEQRKVLADAHKKLHMIEKVRESEEKLHLKEMDRREQKFMDEISTQSHSR
jgi:flagellar export protein FliJ